LYHPDGRVGGFEVGEDFGSEGSSFGAQARAV
jgi:hypothetical protein